jgi:putative ABC transport system permease protein
MHLCGRNTRSSSKNCSRQAAANYRPAACAPQNRNKTVKRLLYELSESWKIAVAQMRANKMRSTLTALGVIIGIVAVTLMGTAVSGIQIGFDKSMAVLGEDVLYVGQWPWKQVDDWWNYRDRKKIKTEYAETVNRMIAAAPNSNLVVAVPTSSLLRGVKYADNEVNNVFVLGTTSDFIVTSTFECKEGRFFNEVESRGGANVCVIGYDVADALFPSESPLNKSVLINGQMFKVLGVNSRMGTFLGLFSWDSMVAMPLGAFNKYFSAKSESDIRVKVKDKTKLAEAKDELTGLMRRIRGVPPEKKDDFSINEQQAFKSTLDPVKNSIAIAGLFITGLSLFVGAIGIMNITFVSVKERTKEIGTRKALGARRRTILLQFLIESTALCLLGGFIGLAFAYLICFGIGQAFPNFPIHFSLGLVLASMIVSVMTGLVSGFAPAWSASRLDPVAALRYE